MMYPVLFSECFDIRREDHWNPEIFRIPTVALLFIGSSVVIRGRGQSRLHLVTDCCEYVVAT